MMELFNDVPVFIGAALAGVLIGSFLETAKPLAWALGVGVFVGMLNWSAMHWYIKPSFSDLLTQGIRATVSGL